MKKRQIPCGIIGMNQDVRDASVNTKQAYEIHNLRLNSTKDGKAFELTSERSTKEIQLCYKDNNNSYQQIDLRNLQFNSGSTRSYKIIGSCCVNDRLVLFCHSNMRDMILSFLYDETYEILYLDKDSNGFNGCFRGNLGWTDETIIEAVPQYENGNVMKVYWVDYDNKQGKQLNQPRVINVKKNYGFIGVYTTTNLLINTPANYDPFAFVHEVDEIPAIQIERNNTGGLFYSGVIQYCVSYYNKYSQETPVVACSNLCYISHNDRGEEPQKQVGCSFKITISNIDNRFEYARLYSVYRSSLDTQPLVKVLTDFKINSSQNNYEFIDDNQSGYDFDAMSILMKRSPIKARTMTDKDMKLFLGNIIESDYFVPWDTFKDNDTNHPIHAYYVNDARQVKYKNSDGSVYDYVNQNKCSSSDIKGFKGGEWYMFGLQFQDIYGQWSDPYPVGVYQNDEYPVFYNEYVELPYFQIDSINQYINNCVIQNNIDPQDFYSNYKKVRPVVSFPTKGERSVLCQGILNPTVFNAGQRWGNTCHSQASWFFRPLGDDDELESKYASFVQNKHDYPICSSDSGNGEIQSMYFSPERIEYENEQEWLHGNPSENKPPLSDPNVEYTPSDMRNYRLKVWPFYKFNVEKVSNSNSQFDWVYKPCDILDKNNYGVPPYTYAYHKSEFVKINQNVNQYRQDKCFSDIEDNERPLYKNCYYVDYETCTLNSPDIEFDTVVDNVDLSVYKCRSAGDIEFKNTQSTYSIIASNPQFMNTKFTSNDIYERSSTLAHGFEKRIISKVNTNGYIMSQTFMWFDELCNLFTVDGEVHSWNQGYKMHAFSVYPWQRRWLNNYSKNAYNPGDASNNHLSCNITNEDETSLIESKILANQRYCETEFSPGHDISETIKLYSSNEATPIKIGNDIYYGNVDQVVAETSNYFGLKWMYDENQNQNVSHVWQYDTIPGYPIIVKKLYYSPLSTGQSGVDFPYIYTQSYDLTFPEYSTTLAERNNNVSELFGDLKFGTRQTPTPNVSSTDPIMIRYKSTKHIVMKIDEAHIGENQNNKHYCILAEVYKDKSPSYDITNANDMMYRQWIQCGDSIDVDENDQTLNLMFKEGDTFVQRYDCLKTYPFSKDDYQSVVEIASFMVETRVNIDGRYDTNRGLDDNTYITNENFNIINKVYSQHDNFFNYHIADNTEFVSWFPNTVIWSQDKQYGQDIDQWTKISTSASMDLDGDKGQITKLAKMKNQIFSLQETGVSRIKYNENIALATDKGAPVELSNSARVTGKEYLSDKYGAQNQQAVQVSQDGLYFYDSLSNGIFNVGSDQYGVVHVSDITDGIMKNWIQKNDIQMISYDKNMNEMMFCFQNPTNTEEKQTLAYRQKTFTSFFDYAGPIFNYNGMSININDNKIYKMRARDDFNSFYGETKPYSIEFIANQDRQDSALGDCIFDNVEYNGDVYKDNDEFISNNISNTSTPFYGTPSGTWYQQFDKIEAVNSYQKVSKTSINAIKKFREWRAVIPRQDGTRARMRDNWIRIKLLNEEPIKYKFVLRSILVDVFC